MSGAAHPIRIAIYEDQAHAERLRIATERLRPYQINGLPGWFVRTKLPGGQVVICAGDTAEEATAEALKQRGATHGR